MMQELSSLVKRLRKQRGLTQEELAFRAGIDRTTLSKIESGKSMPNNSTLRLLIEKLGYGLHGFSNYFLSKEEAEWERLDTTIKAHISRAEYDVAATLIDSIEIDKNSIESNHRRHNVMHYRGQILLHTGKHQEALDMFIDAIKTTTPSFNEQQIKDYHLTSFEVTTINMIASSYAMCGQINNAIEIMMSLKENFDENCVDRDLWGKTYPMLIYHLTRFLCMAKRHKEALPLCDAGRKASVAGYCVYLPYIALNEAYCHAELGNMEESRKQFLEVYHTFNLYKLPANAEAVKRDAKKYADLNI